MVTPRCYGYSRDMPAVLTVQDAVDELRQIETSVRAVRQRLEALQTGQPRTCPVCLGPVVGRSDRVYCSARCRTAAHRAAK